MSTHNKFSSRNQKNIDTFFVSIAPDTARFSTKKYRYFSYFSMKTYVVGIHLKRLAKALQMSTGSTTYVFVEE